MPSATSTTELHQRVTGWFRNNARELPWREPDCSPWGIMVSEFMLQQTPVARVLPVWQQWLSRWPTPADLAAAPSGDAVRYWGRLGYPRRALRLHAAAVCLVEHHGGAVPASYASLLALPGVGSYTAAAIASFAFGLPATVVDTNIRRVHARAITGKALPAPALTAAEMRLAEDLMPDAEPMPAPSSAAAAAAASTKAWNASVMELGATVCTARSPKCELCPLLDICAWVLTGRPEADYVPKAQSWTGTDRQVRGAILAVLRESTTAVQRNLLLVAPVDLACGAAKLPELDTYTLEMRGSANEALDILHALNAPAEQLERALAGLLSDGLVEACGRAISLPA